MKLEAHTIPMIALHGCVAHCLSIPCGPEYHVFCAILLHPCSQLSSSAKPPQKQHLFNNSYPTPICPVRALSSEQRGGVEGTCIPAGSGMVILWFTCPRVCVSCFVSCVPCLVIGGRGNRHLPSAIQSPFDYKFLALQMIYQNASKGFHQDVLAYPSQREGTLFFPSDATKEAVWQQPRLQTEDIKPGQTHDKPWLCNREETMH